MFGHSQLLGDVLDMIHTHGGRLDRIVWNVPEVLRPRQLPIAHRLARAPYKIGFEPLDDFKGVPVGYACMIGFTGGKKAPLVKLLKERWGIYFSNLIHPTAVISPTAELGEGIVINAGAVVAAYTKIHDHVVINRGATIGHDVELMDYAVVQPQANITSYTRLGVGAVLSASAVAVENLNIGDGSIVAAGAAVVRDVPPHVMVAGVPAVVKKEIPPSPAEG